MDVSVKSSGFVYRLKHKFRLPAKLSSRVQRRNSQTRHQKCALLRDGLHPELRLQFQLRCKLRIDQAGLCSRIHQKA